MKKFNKGLIIGPSGIGNAHIREYKNYGIKNIGILRKNFNKNKIDNSPNIQKKNLKFLKKFKEIENFKPDVISLCTPHYYHIRHLKLINSIYTGPIIVEKPFIIDKSFSYIKHKKIIDYFYKNFENISVNLPMTSVALQLKKFLKQNKIKNIDFFYNTGGKHKFGEILIDLLPHALSFVLTTANQKLKNFQIIKLLIKKQQSKIKLKINNIDCNFNFKQNEKNKDSSLMFLINNEKFERFIIKENDIHSVYFRTNKKNIKIQNPMSVSLSNSLNELNKKKYNKKNKMVVESITKITCYIFKKFNKL